MCVPLTMDVRAERKGCVKGAFLSNTHRTFSVCCGHAFTLLEAISCICLEPRMWWWYLRIYEWADADTIRGRILFFSAKAIVRILFEGGHYSTCGYYSRKYGILLRHIDVELCHMIYTLHTYKRQKAKTRILAD